MRKILTVLLAAVFVLCLFPASASAVSDSDLSTGVFEPCEYIPSFASVPDFYTPIENVTCMYMFIDADGVPHKRWYGSIDGAYGWYAVEDGETTVRPYSMPVNTEDDRAMLYKESQNEYSTATDLGYVGLLPPEESRTEITEIFGVPMEKFILYAGGGVAALCLLIMISAAAVKSRRKRRWHF